MKNKFKFDLDYEDDTFDDFFDNDNTEVVSEEIIEDNTVDEYDKFNEISEINDYEVIDDNNDVQSYSEESSTDINYLSLAYVCFSRIGVVIVVILMAIFITNGDFFSFFKYILLLVGSFMIGYLGMFLFDKFKENN